MVAYFGICGDSGTFFQNHDIARNQIPRIDFLFLAVPYDGTLERDTSFELRNDISGLSVRLSDDLGDEIGINSDILTFLGTNRQ